MKSRLIYFALPFLLACGGGYNPDKDGAHQNQKLGDSFSYVDLGEGRGLMLDSADAIASSSNFAVTFSLEDQGTLKVFTYAKGNLSGAFEIVFRREGERLLVFLRNQNQEQDLSPLFAETNATQVLSFNFDIHNNERPAHMLLWAGEKRAGLNHRNTIYNSGEDSLDLGYDSSPGNGLGRAWGFELQGSRLMNATRTSAQDAH